MLIRLDPREPRLRPKEHEWDFVFERKQRTAEVAKLQPLRCDNRVVHRLPILGLLAPESKHAAMVTLINQGKFTLWCKFAKLGLDLGDVADTVNHSKDIW